MFWRPYPYWETDSAEAEEYRLEIGIAPAQAFR